MRPAVSQFFRSACRRASIVGRSTVRPPPFILSTCRPIFPRSFSINNLQFDHKPGPNALSLDDHTIYALSTAPGRAAIAVIRISGPSCVEVGLNLITKVMNHFSDQQITDIPCAMPEQTPPKATLRQRTHNPRPTRQLRPRLRRSRALLPLPTQRNR